MTLRLFILFIMLLALLGMLTVHEEAARLRAGYRLAQLDQQNEATARRVAELQRDIASLCRPDRLAALNTELNLGLRPLPTLQETGRVAVAPHITQ